MFSAIVLGMHLHSIHLDPEPWQNNANVGIYAMGDGWTLGGYHNTIRRPTFYGGYTWGWESKGFQATAGIATGYKTRTFITPCECDERHRSRGWERDCTEFTTQGTKSGLRPLLAVHYVFPDMNGVSPRITASRNLLHFSIQKEWK